MKRELLTTVASFQGWGSGIGRLPGRQCAINFIKKRPQHEGNIAVG
jgi:hypothetical protein